MLKPMLKAQNILNEVGNNQIIHKSCLSVTDWDPRLQGLRATGVLHNRPSTTILKVENPRLASRRLDKKTKAEQACQAGLEFANLFYETFDKKRHLVTNLYLENATAVWNGNGYVGKENVSKLYESLPVSSSELRAVDAQAIPDELSHGHTTILVSVTGSVKFTGKNTCMFSESFILTAQPGGEKGNVWKIASECFRFHEPVAEVQAV